MPDNKIEEIIWNICGTRNATDEERLILIEAIKKGDKQTKISAARALSRLKDKRERDLDYILDIFNIETNSLSLIEAVAQYGTPAIEKLKELLKISQSNSRKHQRRNILRVFAFIALHLEVDEIKWIFLKYLNDSFSGVRIACLQGIQKIKLKEAVPIIEKLLENEKDERVKNYATTVLNELNVT